MFDAIIQFAIDKFHLGDKAKGLVGLLLNAIFDSKQGGFNGFANKFTDAGLGDIFNSWIGGTANAKEIQPDQVFSALGTDSISSMAKSLGLPNAAVSNAAAGLLPMIIGKLTAGGTIPSSMPSGLGSLVSGFSGTTARAASHNVEEVAAASSGLGWLKWLIPLALLALLGYCALNRKPAETVPAVDSTATVEEVAPAVVEAEPMVEPAGVTADAAATPAIAAANVYFDVASSTLPADTDSSLAEMIAYLNANPDSRASISGYHSPEGDAAVNDELSKNRAIAVRDHLVAAGIGTDRLDLDKPMIAEGGGVERESRRVEVRIK